MPAIQGPQLTSLSASSPSSLPQSTPSYLPVRLPLSTYLHHGFSGGHITAGLHEGIAWPIQDEAHKRTLHCGQRLEGELGEEEEEEAGMPCG